MNDRHRTIQQFYRRNHDLYMREMMGRIRKWTARVYHEYVASVTVEKLKGNLKDGTVQRDFSCEGCQTPKHICGICTRNYPNITDHYTGGEAG